MLPGKADQSLLAGLRASMTRAIQRAPKGPRSYRRGDLVVVMAHGGDNKWSGHTAEVIDHNGGPVYQLEIRDKDGRVIAEFPCGAAGMKPARSIIGLPKVAKRKG